MRKIINFIKRKKPVECPTCGSLNTTPQGSGIYKCNICLTFFEEN